MLLLLLILFFYIAINNRNSCLKMQPSTGSSSTSLRWARWCTSACQSTRALATSRALLSSSLKPSRPLPRPARWDKHRPNGRRVEWYIYRWYCCYYYYYCYYYCCCCYCYYYYCNMLNDIFIVIIIIIIVVVIITVIIIIIVVVVIIIIIIIVIILVLYRNSFQWINLLMCDILRFTYRLIVSCFLRHYFLPIDWYYVIKPALVAKASFTPYLDVCTLRWQARYTNKDCISNHNHHLNKYIN